MTVLELVDGDAFLVAFDVVGFSRLESDQTRLDFRARLYTTLRDSFDAAGIPWDSCYWEDRGDGVFVVVGSEHPAHLLIDPLVGRLQSSIRRHNAAARHHGQFRLRMALHAGAVARDRHGVVGTEVNQLFRMMEASPVRRLASSSGIDFVLVVSKRVYHELIEGDRLALGPGDFRSIEVSVREVRTRAWVYVSEASVATSSVAGHEVSFASSAAEPSAAQAFPRDVVHFVGRRREFARLEEIRANAANGGPAAVVQGPAGVGKTALVVRWAHQIRDRFTDQIFVDLHSLDTSQALSTLLSLLGVRAQAVPAELEARAAMYRSLIADRKILLVLDNTSSVDVVRPLLPTSSSCLAIVIARDLDVALALAQIAEMIQVGPLAEGEAVDLLGELIGPDLVSTDRAAAEELARLCGHLPLALQLAATNLIRYPGDRIGDAVRGLTRAEAELPPGPGDSAVQANFDIVYRDLEDDVQRAFRFLSLVEGLNVSAETICTLLETGTDEAFRLLEDLADVSFIEPAGPGEYRMRPLLLDFSRMRSLQDDAEDDRQAALDRYVNALRRDYLPEASISRDYWTLDDHLSYRPYADAISAFIRHRETRPPLTIAVKAPWGAGKTSLMRMIQDGLDPRSEGGPCGIRLTKDSRNRIGRRKAGTGPATNEHVTNREILRETVERPERLAQEPLTAEAEGNDRLAAKDWRPTVWFNPWMYQTGEQVWAGLAFEVISQVTARLPVGDRERFWLRLNLARVDSEAVRRRCYRTLVERLLPFLAIWSCGLLLALCSLLAVQLLPGWRHLAQPIIGAACSTGTVLFVGAAGWRSLRFFASTVTGPLTDIVRKPDLLGRGNRALGFLNQELKGEADKIFSDPGYSTRAGFLHLVQTDITKVFNLVATQERPLVIFVDDLDRCSPGTVAQVIEAINLFLAGEFPNCVFVLGMEPAAVAANVEVAYKDLASAHAEGRPPGDWSTLGWRFLEKFVQLSVSLPPPRDQTTVDGYLTTLLGTPMVRPNSSPPQNLAADPATPPSATAFQTGTSETGAAEAEAAAQPTAPFQEHLRPAAADVDQLAAAIRRRGPTPNTLREAALDAQREVTGNADALDPTSMAAAERVFTELYSDAAAHNAIASALTLLPTRNPREIKRFVNVFRFYTFVSQMHRLRGYPAATGDQVAKVAAFSIRWPQLVGLLFAPPTGDAHPLVTLDFAARGEADSWWQALKENAPSLRHQAEQPAWCQDLREFLRTGPEVSNAAARLL